MSNGPFTTDLERIRARARTRMAEGAVTPSYGADRQRVIEVLNEVLATETVCALRYRHNAYTASGIQAAKVVEEFEEHAAEEQEHADRVARRIVQLGGQPNLSPDGLLARSHSEYETPDGLEEMIRANLVAERIAIDTYTEIVRWIADRDPTTRRMMEEILAKEEEHAQELADLLPGITH